MSKKKEILMTVITLMLCVVLFAERLTGGIIHAVLGLLVVMIMAVHVGGQMKKMKYKKPSVRIVDWVLMASLVLLLVTGVLLHPMQDVLALKILHKLAAVLFVLGVIGHILQHRRR